MLDKIFLNIADKLGATEETVEVQDPYEFIFKYSYTLDPHDINNPIKKIPDYPYIRELIQIFLKEKLIAVVKSRQLLVTWLFCALHVWLCAFHKGQYVFFISRKEADAGFDSPLSLCSRAHFIMEHLPKDLKPEYTKSLQPPILKFTKNFSTLHGVSQDSDALRQYTASSVFSDEMAFQEHASDAYAAIKPTIDGGGRLVCVSTPNGKNNLFYKIIMGKLISIN
jgi:phage FluMu gp28-like protein